MNARGEGRIARKGVSLVIPAWNEEKRLGQTLNKFIPALQSRGEPFEFIVVVDGSSDMTAEMARTYWARGVKVLEFPYRLGKGGAVLAGLRLSRYDTVGYLDADGPVEPSEFLRLLDTLKEYDCAFASRRAPGSDGKGRYRASREAMSRLWNVMVRSILLLPYYDTQCGAKVFRRSTLPTILKHVALTNWAFDVSILFHLQRMGYAIKEVPVSWSDDPASKLNVVKVVPGMFLSLIGIRLRSIPPFSILPDAWLKSFLQDMGVLAPAPTAVSIGVVTTVAREF